MPRTATAKKPKEEIPPAVPGITAPVPERWVIHIEVDWQNLPMPQAQEAYAFLQKAHQDAGKILNARSSPQKAEQWRCFMAGTPGACELGKIYDTRPVFEDRSRVAPKGGHHDPVTGDYTAPGLAVPVKICSERCYHIYNALLIAERRERENPGLNG